MTSILTAAEASQVLRTTSTDALMLSLLPSVDAYICQATGHDWAGDTQIREEAKAAARMLLVMWYENPAMVGSGISSLSSGLTAVLVQLEALALRYAEFEGINGAGGINLLGAHVGDTVSTLVGLIGAAGDQLAKFETVITVEGQIQQISTDDQSGKFYRAYLVPLESSMNLNGKISNPGEMRTQITLQTRGVADNAGGFRVPGYSTLATVWSKWTNFHGSEVLAADAAGITSGATVVIRYLTGFDETGRVVKGSQTYEVISIDDILDRHEYIELKLKALKAA